ncbi:hypothetical protein [Ureibacillus sinduriensis]|uniref:Uncharacterized protein n=1 Tax=Ureibacillus sinduriensis BLB-1 = JCM 15800 TaxID=1384057 RepID=A0A0A3HRH5_9BACL|nr:hypothetical protein [Ureibacillus sinduriensis]KGR75211.1 hypothetical protein CD33_13170 [Ureibacillus sinduriensis BLB-1 = JCM 15800]
MNEQILELLLKSEVKKLPDDKRQLYQFIIDIEDSLVEKSNSVDEYLRVFKAHSPYAIASRYFNMPFNTVAELMNEIEDELAERIEERCEKLKWLDYTDQFIEASCENNRRQVFLFMN